MCLFCDIYKEKADLVYENRSVFVIFDHYPVSKGHCLIITKRHIEDYFATTKEEAADIDLALKQMKIRLDESLHPDGYNIGINNHAAAGQTIMHLHVHLIPRYQNDVENPRGGIRGVIPGKQNYESDDV